MTQLTREGLVAVRRPGTRLFLAGGPRMQVGFEGPSERTLFWPRSQAEAELKRLHIPKDSVELRDATLSAQIS